MAEHASENSETAAAAPLEQRIALEPDGLRKAQLLFELSLRHIEASEPGAARTAAEQILELTAGLADSDETQRLTARGLAMVAQAEFLLRNYPQVVPLAQRSLSLALQLDDALAEQRATNALALAAQASGDNASAIHHFEQSLKAARRSGDEKAEGKVYSNLGRLHSDQGELAQALEHHLKSLALFERLRSSHLTGIAHINIGAVYGELGDWEKSVEYFYRALVEQEKEQYRLGMAICYLNIASIYLKRNKHERAIQCAELAARCAEEARAPQQRLMAMGLLGEAYFQAGDLLRTRSIYDRNIRTARELNLPREQAHNLRRKAELLLAQPEPTPAEAVELLEQALRLLATGASALDRAHVEGVLGRAYAVSSDPARAERHFQSAVQILRASGRGLELGKVLFDYGRFLVEREQRGPGTELVSEAARIFKRLEVIAESEAAERYLFQLNSEQDRRLSLLRSLTSLTSHSLPLSQFAPRCLEILRTALDFASGTFLVEEGRSFQLGPALTERELHECRRGELLIGDTNLFLPLRLSGRNVGGIYLHWPPIESSPGSGLSDRWRAEASFFDIVANLLSVAMERNRAQTPVPAVTSGQVGDADAALTTPAACGPAEHPGARYTGFIGCSATLPDIFDTIEQVSPTNACVLIRGESGTGKELIARIIVDRSTRRDEPFVAINCAALPENLLEAELFGIEKGVATGVVERKGKFEQAHRGTLFLDEIGDMSLVLQSKLLRVLQEREFERVGGRRTIEVDTRILAATNKDLEKAIADGHFRQDLYYRLNVVTLLLPPLRERQDDIPLLVSHFIQKYNEEFGRQIRGVSPDVLNAMLEYPWPGNVRELLNAIERAVILCRTELIPINVMPPALQQVAQHLQAASPGLGSVSTLDDVRELRRHVASSSTAVVEKNLIAAALKDCRGNAAQAARQLGVSRTHLYRLLEKYNLRREPESAPGSPPAPANGN